LLCCVSRYQELLLRFRFIDKKVSKSRSFVGDRPTNRTGALLRRPLSA
jgi:hypothetical protein